MHRRLKHGQLFLPLFAAKSAARDGAFACVCGTLVIY